MVYPGITTQPSGPLGTLHYKGIYLEVHIRSQHFVAIWLYSVFAKHAGFRASRFSSSCSQRRQTLRSLRHASVSSTVYLTIDPMVNYKAESINAVPHSILSSSGVTPQRHGTAYRRVRSMGRTLRYGLRAYPGLSRDEGSGCWMGEPAL